ncbi:MAG: ABC transporter permease [Candidatus Syntropharchaeia archaeon]
MKDAILLAYRNIRERKSRSMLTMLGIAVGIAAIVALMSIGYGMQESVTGQLSEMGDMVMVMPGRMSFEAGYLELGSLDERDLKDVERMVGVKEAAGMMGKMVEVEYRDEKVMVEVIGIEPRDIHAVFGKIVGIEEGRRLKDNDHRSCELGYKVAKDYFNDEIHVNDRITINGSKFRVVGILERQGGFRSDVDAQIYITKRDAAEVLDVEDFSTIFVRVWNIEEAEEVAEEIEERIDENHKLDDFCSAMTMGSVIRQLKSVFGILQAILLAIASISLIVASIGIMNTMLMAVMERTHEIGVMKAIGAKNRDILFLFLLEAGVVSIVGGLLGCVFGIAGAEMISMGISTGFDVEIPAVLRPDVLLGGIGVAVVVGILSGLYPARKAARMSPIEAVRYE